MDSFKRRANRLKEQVAKQQQAVVRQFASHGYASSQGSDSVVTDEAERQRHLQLEKLYSSTRAGKYFQRDIVKGVEGIILTGSRQIEVVNRICENCCKYASESLGTQVLLGKALNHYGINRTRVEREKEILYNTLSTQVIEPLKAMVNGAPLEDARHLAQRYDRMRQDAEVQAAEIGRRQARGGGAENAMKLQIAEAKLQEIASSMAVLGKEAAAAMTAVETQQQRLSLQRLIAMVDAERKYHQHAAEILDQIQAEVLLERQRSGSMPPMSVKAQVIDTIANALGNNGVKRAEEPAGSPEFSGGLDIEKPTMYLAEVMHAFNAESEGELSLAVGDMVVVRQVSQSGWSEGECKGKAGWFPSAYVEHRQHVPISKVTEAF